MTPDRPEFRLSDAEREEAIEALGEHLREGRLDIDEYGDRTARVTAAKTRGELLSLFTDLPEPRPAVLREHLPAPPRAARPPERRNGAWLASSAVPIAAVIALVLFFTAARGFWPIFLLPAAVALFAAAAFGSSRPGRG